MPNPMLGMAPGASGPATMTRPLAAPFQRIDPMAARGRGGQMVAGFGYTPPVPQPQGVMAPGASPPGYGGSMPMGPGGGFGGGLGGAPGAPGGGGLGGMGPGGYDGHPGIGPSQGIGGPASPGNVSGPTAPSGPSGGLLGGMGNAPGSLGGQAYNPGMVSGAQVGGLLGMTGVPGLGQLGSLAGMGYDLSETPESFSPGFGGWMSAIANALSPFGIFGTSFPDQVHQMSAVNGLAGVGALSGGNKDGPTGNVGKGIGSGGYGGGGFGGMGAGIGGMGGGGGSGGKGSTKGDGSKKGGN